MEMELQNKKNSLIHSLEPEQVEDRENGDIHKNNNNPEEEEIEYLDFIPYQDCDQNDDNILLIKNINKDSFIAINCYILK